MPSPFPGMDPYLEGSLWPDVHQRVAAEISRHLSPILRPKYVTRLAVAAVEEGGLASGINLIYPDVEIVRRNQPARDHRSGVLVLEPAIEITPALDLRLDSQDRVVSVEIYDLEHNQLVTSIEILSPVNKRQPGLAKFIAKRERLTSAGVNFLTIDLLRRGERALPSTSSPESALVAQADYLVTLLRGMDYRMQAWPIRLEDSLPVVAVPLRHPDPDVPLDLGGVLAVIYDEAGYDLTIDYSAPPPAPSLDEESAAWLARQLQSVRTEGDAEMMG